VSSDTPITLDRLLPGPASIPEGLNNALDLVFPHPHFFQYPSLIIFASTPLNIIFI
jgi:hypothetical protein